MEDLWQLNEYDVTMFLFSCCHAKVAVLRPQTLLSEYKCTLHKFKKEAKIVQTHEVLGTPNTWAHERFSKIQFASKIKHLYFRILFYLGLSGCNCFALCCCITHQTQEINQQKPYSLRVLFIKRFILMQGN